MTYQVRVHNNVLSDKSVTYDVHLTDVDVGTIVLHAVDGAAARAIAATLVEMINNHTVDIARES